MASRRVARRARKSARVRTEKVAAKAKPDGWLTDQAIERAIDLERVKASESRRLQAIWDDATDRILDAVIGRISRLSERRRASNPWLTVGYLDAIKRVVDIMAESAQTFRRESRAITKLIADAEAKWHLAMTERALPFGLDLRRVPAEQIRALAKAPVEGRTLANWSQGLAQSGAARVQATVAKGLRDGHGTLEIAAKVRKAMDVTKAHAETVVRTAISHASSGASEAFAQANSDLIIGVRWLSVLDSRTSAICRSLSGRVFRTGQGPRPPLHPRERSRCINLTRSAMDVLTGKKEPVTDAYLKEAGDRAFRGLTMGSHDEKTNRVVQTKAGTTYGQWLKRQPAAAQDRILGRTRGKLFRSGKVKIEDFVGSDYKPLTLDQIQARAGLSDETMWRARWR